MKNTGVTKSLVGERCLDFQLISPTRWIRDNRCGALLLAFLPATSNNDVSSKEVFHAY
jgi:hypothetical protein